jgi:hypothetical protein
MSDIGWSVSEKKLARSAFEDALEAALAKILADFKAKAAAVTKASDLWPIEDYLRRRRREIDELFDYRYSQLLFVFARLIHEGYLDEARLSGLSEEKRAIIRRVLS